MLPEEAPMSGVRGGEDPIENSDVDLRDLFDAVSEAIITITQGGIVVAANKATATMFGYPAEDLIGRDIKVLIPGSYLLDAGPSRQDPMSPGAQIGADRGPEGRRKDGSMFPIEVATSEIQYGGQRMLVCLVRDLSERGGLESPLLLHRNRLDLIAEMASALTHEINQPLAAASNYLAVARHALGGQNEVRGPAVEALEKASAQMVRAGKIVSHLREFILGAEPDKHEQSLHDLIRRTCEFLRPSAQEANVEIILKLLASEDRVLVDGVQIEQAVINLARCAIEAMGGSQERSLTIATALENGTIRAEFAGAGPGLSEEMNSDLFASAQSNDLDVGLRISRSIVEAHHGTIRAGGNSGGGAKFSFTLPLVPQECA
jgi:PAS domain S-box-containing protein